MEIAPARLRGVRLIRGGVVAVPRLLGRQIAVKHRDRAAAGRRIEIVEHIVERVERAFLSKPRRIAALIRAAFVLKDARQRVGIGVRICIFVGNEYQIALGHLRIRHR